MGLPGRRESPQPPLPSMTLTSISPMSAQDLHRHLRGSWLRNLCSPDTVSLLLFPLSPHTPEMTCLPSSSPPPFWVHRMRHPLPSMAAGHQSLSLWPSGGSCLFALFSPSCVRSFSSTHKHVHSKANLDAYSPPASTQSLSSPSLPGSWGDGSSWKICFHISNLLNCAI